MRLHSTDGEIRLHITDLNGPRFKTGATSQNKGEFEAETMTLVVCIEENAWRVNAVNLEGPMVLADGVGLAAKMRGRRLFLMPLDMTDPAITPEVATRVQVLVYEAMLSWLPGGHKRHDLVDRESEIEAETESV